MGTSKSKLQITSGKQPKAKLGASTSSEKKASSPLMPKKDYKKPGSQGADIDFGGLGFGETGLSGES